MKTQKEWHILEEPRETFGIKLPLSSAPKSDILILLEHLGADILR